MATWRDLGREIEAWTTAAAPPTFWWRDDDATVLTPALERLLTLSESSGVPLALAAIPRDLADDARARLAPVPDHAVLQHGFAHANHAPADQRKCEYGEHRPLETIRDEISDGWRRIRRCSGALPVFVPPWNRISEAVVELLHACGLRGLSTLGARAAAGLEAGLVQANVHVDIIDWRGSRGFAGDDAVLEQVLAHLRGRRAGTVDADETTGLMTHHRDHDDGCWDFVQRLFEFTRGRVTWLTAREVFAV